MSLRPWVLAALVVAVALPFTGAGPQNGDQAVYLDQVARGAWFERWTHVGYVLLHARWGTPWRSDVLSVLVGAVGLGWFATQRGIAAGAVLACFLLPALPFGEVDVHWFVAVVFAVRTAGWWPLGIVVSPTALVASAWLALRWGDRRLLLGPAVVVLLVVASDGAWWNGRRGIWTSSWSLDPLGQILPGLVAAVVLARRPRALELVALSPILLAPGDVPAGWLGVLAVGWGARRLSVPAPLRVLVAGGLILWSGTALVTTGARIQAETARVEELAARVQPGDRLVGPWSWRVRVALAATGRADGLDEGEGRVLRVPDGQVDPDDARQ